MTMPATIIAIPPDGPLTRERAGKISPQPTFYVEWYDELSDQVRMAAIDGDAAKALAPELFAQALNAIDWRGRVARAECV